MSLGREPVPSDAYNAAKLEKLFVCALQREWAEISTSLGPEPVAVDRSLAGKFSGNLFLRLHIVGIQPISSGL